MICAGIHMSDIPAFPYRLLWGERSVRSVANLTCDDGTAFFKELQHTPVHCGTTSFPLDDANQALALLRTGQFNGAIVLIRDTRHSCVCLHCLGGWQFQAECLAIKQATATNSVSTVFSTD